MVGVHVVEDSTLLRLRERIVDQKLSRLDPMDLTEPSNESEAHEIDSIKGKIMRLVVLARLGNMTEIPLGSPPLALLDGRGVSNQGQTPSRLHLVIAGMTFHNRQ